jgi:hypothetical protein
MSPIRPRNGRTSVRGNPRGHPGTRRRTACSGRSWRSISRVWWKSHPGICVRSPMSGRSTHRSSAQPSRPLASSLLSRKKAAALTTRVNATASDLPQILPTRSARIDAGDRMGLRASNESVLKGVRSVPLVRWFPGAGADDPGAWRDLVPRRPLSPRQAPPPEPPERANCAGYSAAGSVSSSVK